MNDFLLFLLKQTASDRSYDIGLIIGHFIRESGLYIAILVLLLVSAIVVMIKQYRKKTSTYE